MNDRRALSPQEAEAVVARRIEMFGLGALPTVTVIGDPDGSWHVGWNSVERTVAPMGLDAWRAWLEENVGSLDAGDLETTES